MHGRDPRAEPAVPPSRRLARVAGDAASERDRSRARPPAAHARPPELAASRVPRHHRRRHQRQGLLRRAHGAHSRRGRLSRRHVHLAASAPLQRAHRHRRRRSLRRGADGGVRAHRRGPRRRHADVLRVQRGRCLAGIRRRSSPTPSCSKSAWAVGSTRSMSSTPTSRWSRRSISITATGSAATARRSAARRRASSAPAGRRFSAPATCRRRFASPRSSSARTCSNSAATSTGCAAASAGPGADAPASSAICRAPALHGEIQYDNAAAVLAALEALESRLRVPRSAIERGLQTVTLPGRFQVVQQTSPRPDRVDPRCRTQPGSSAHARDAARSAEDAAAARSRCAACWATRTSRASSASCETRSTPGSSSDCRALARCAPDALAARVAECRRERRGGCGRRRRGLPGSRGAGAAGRPHRGVRLVPDRRPRARSRARV